MFWALNFYQDVDRITPLDCDLPKLLSQIVNMTKK